MIELRNKIIGMVWIITWIKLGIKNEFDRILSMDNTDSIHDARDFAFLSHMDSKHI